MQYLQIWFHNREKPFCFPVSDSTATDLLADLAETGSLKSLRLVETYYGQKVFVNYTRVQYVRVLLEAELPLFPYPDQQNSLREDLELEQKDPEGTINITLWFSGRRQSLNVHSVEVGEWETCLFLCDVDKEGGFCFDDEDKEPVIVQKSQLDLMIGTEVDGYTEDQLDLLSAALKDWANESSQADLASRN